MGKFAVILKIGDEPTVAHGKSSTQQACRKRSVSRDRNSFAVERCAFAARCSVQLVVERIKHGGNEQRVALRQRDGNAETGVPVREICSAIEGINMPTKFRSGRALVSRPLFCRNGMLRKIL